MSLIDLILRRDTPTDTTPSIQSDADVLLKALLTGQPISKESALSIPAVSEAVDRIGNIVASLPVRLYQESTGADGQRRVKEIHADPRTLLLNVEPGDMLDAFQTKKALTRDYLLDQGGFLFINQKPSGFIDSLNYVDPGFVGYYKNADPIFKVAQYLVNGRRYETHQFVVLLRNTSDGIAGKPLIHELSKVLASAVETVAFELGLAVKGGSKKGFLTAKSKLDDKAMGALRDAWRKLYGNSEENIVILNDGMEFKEAGATSQELQLAERKKSLAEELKGVFHVSDDFDKTVKDAVMPVLNAFESAFTRNLLTEAEKAGGLYFAFDTKEITKGDIKQRYEAYKIAAAAGFMTKNEIRYREDLDPIEGLDVVSLGLGDVLYDVKNKEYYTPNTGQTKTPGQPTNPAAELVAEDDAAAANQPFNRFKRQGAPVMAGLAVMAADTGRVLMLQRAKVEGDDAGGCWEFPGGHIEDAEDPLAAALREWSEEVGQQVPAGSMAASWTSTDGIYAGFVWLIDTEATIALDDRETVTNPDDPDGDILEAIAWYDPAHLVDNPAVRPELATDIETVTEAIKAAGSVK